MRTTTTATLLGLSLLLFGCEARTATPEPSGEEGGAAAPAEPTLFSQEEADAYYEEEIAGEEFDEELDKLMEEISSDEAAGDS